MGFIDIYKGEERINVPEDTFNQIYKRLGWTYNGEYDNRNEFEKFEEEMEEEEPDLDKMSASQLKKYAEQNDVNINGLTTKADIKNKIINELYEVIE